MLYRYETHCHTVQSSKCARADAADSVRFYASLGYGGIWITDHLSSGNLCGYDWVDAIHKHSEGYRAAKAAGDECGIDVFYGWEFTATGEAGTDFLTYGLDTQWLFDHPELFELTSKQYLETASADGALLFQAHPFRGSAYIDAIRLLPRYVAGAEVANANRTDFENRMASDYVREYELMPFAGSDNHLGSRQSRLCGVTLPRKANDAADWCNMIRNRQYMLFDNKQVDNEQ